MFGPVEDSLLLRMKLMLPIWIRKRPQAPDAPAPAPAATGTAFMARRRAHLRLGRRGERLARSLLRVLGLDVLDCNYAGKHGEIDLVARDGEVLCFVEVKTRHRSWAARPAAAVHRDKQRRLVRTAHQYLRELGHPAVRYRFDIVEVLLNRWQARDIRYYRNAFTEDGLRRPAGDRFPDPPAIA